MRPGGGAQAELLVLGVGLPGRRVAADRAGRGLAREPERLAQLPRRGLEAKFKQRDFAELDNAQAIVVPYDGVRALPATRCYLKPHYLPRERSYFRQRERGEL